MKLAQGFSNRNCFAEGKQAVGMKTSGKRPKSIPLGYFREIRWLWLRSMRLHGSCWIPREEISGEQYLTFLILDKSSVDRISTTDNIQEKRWGALGKTNIVAREALVTGDFENSLVRSKKRRTRAKCQVMVVDRNLNQGPDAESPIFTERNGPSMAPTEGKSAFGQSSDEPLSPWTWVFYGEVKPEILEVEVPGDSSYVADL